MTNPYNNDPLGGPQGSEGKHAQPEGNAVPPQQPAQPAQPAQPQQWQQPAQPAQPQQPWQQQGQPQQPWQQPGQPQQGVSAKDVAQQQAQQFAANVKKGFNSANTSYATASVSTLGFLPLLIGSVLLLVLAIFPWSSLKLEYLGDEVSLSVSGLGLVGMSAVGMDFSNEELDTFGLAIGYFGILLPLVTVALYCTAALLFRDGAKHRVAAALTVLGAVIGSYWVFFASRSATSNFADLGSTVSKMASDMDPFVAALAEEFIGFEFTASISAVYWVALIVMIVLLLHSAYLFWRVTKEQGGFNAADGQTAAPQPAATQTNPAQGSQQGFPTNPPSDS